MNSANPNISTAQSARLGIIAKSAGSGSLKFRIQSSNVHEEMIRELGGIPQKLPFKEVYTALGQGVVDGQENTWSNIYSKRFYA